MKAYDSEDVSDDSEEEKKQQPQVSDKEVAQQLAQGMGIRIPKSKLTTNVSKTITKSAKPAASNLLIREPNEDMSL